MFLKGSRKKLILVFTFAFIIRLIALNQSLWLDEGTTARVVKEYSYSEIITKFSPTDFHPPLYYLFMKLWTGFFGYSEIALRMPSIIFSLLTGWFVYLIGKKLKSEHIGFWASIFFLFNPLIVYYSQEARQYMMATFLLTVGLYYFLRLCHPEFISGSDSGQARMTKSKIKNQSASWRTKLQIKNQKLLNILLFSLFISLSFFTFYGSVFLITIMLLYFLYKKQYKIFIISLAVFIVSLLIISPLLYQQLINARDSLKIVTNWSLVLGEANFKNLLLIPLKFAFGRISFYPKKVYYLLAGLWTVAVWFFIVRGGIKNKPIMFIIFITIIIALIFSFYSPLLQYFRFLYLLPMISLLLSFGVKKNWQRITLSAGFLVLSLIYLLNPNFHREDWKSLAESLSKAERIYIILSSSDALKYYRSDLKLIDLRNINNPQKKEIIVIPYAADIYGFDYQKKLLNNNFELIDKTIFRQLIKERWISATR